MTRSRADILGSGQLSMLMSAREITERFQPSDWDRDKIRDPQHGLRPETNEEVMERKLTESKSWSHGNIYPSIEREGVKQPVHLSHQFAGTQRRGPGPAAPGMSQIMEGHHRIASSMAIDPDRLIPVIHHETPDDVGHYIMEHE